MLRLPAGVRFCVFSGYRGLQIPCRILGNKLEGPPPRPPGPGPVGRSAASAAPGAAVRLPSRTQNSIPSLTGRSRLSAQTSAPGVASSLNLHVQVQVGPYIYLDLDSSPLDSSPAVFWETVLSRLAMPSDRCPIDRISPVADHPTYRASLTYVWGLCWRS